MKVGRKTFNFLIDAWAFSGELDAADHAMSLLDRMEFLQNFPDFVSSSPDVRSYTKVINAISRSARPDAGDVAESILNKMEQLLTNFDDSGDFVLGADFFDRAMREGSQAFYDPADALRRGDGPSGVL